MKQTIPTFGLYSPTTLITLFARQRIIRFHRRSSLQHRRTGFPPVRLRPLAGHARRPHGGRFQAQRDRHGHEKTQGPQDRTSRPCKLPGQVVTSPNTKFGFNIKLPAFKFNFLF